MTSAMRVTLVAVEVSIWVYERGLGLVCVVTDIFRFALLGIFLDTLWTRMAWAPGTGWPLYPTMDGLFWNEIRWGYQC